MKIEQKNRQDGVTAVLLEGELNYHFSGELREKLSSIASGKPARLLVNMAGVPYIDSSAIAAFVEMSQKMKAHGGKTVFCGLTENVRSIFELAKLNLFFTLAGSEEEAAALLRE